MEGDQNQMPIAIDDSAETPQGTPVIVDVLDNDSDPDGDDFWIDTITQGGTENDPLP